MLEAEKKVACSKQDWGQTMWMKLAEDTVAIQ